MALLIVCIAAEIGGGGGVGTSLSVDIDIPHDFDPAPHFMMLPGTRPHTLHRCDELDDGCDCYSL